MEHNKLRDPDYYLEINTFSDLVSFLCSYISFISLTFYKFSGIFCYLKCFMIEDLFEQFESIHLNHVRNFETCSIHLNFGQIDMVENYLIENSFFGHSNSFQ